MRIRHIQTRFLLAGFLLVVATVGSSVWSALTFYRLSDAADETVTSSRETIDASAELTSSLEREDDALLLSLSGDTARARQELDIERRRGDSAFERLRTRLRDEREDERSLAEQLEGKIDLYRQSGNELVATRSQTEAMERYHRKVNPLLRQAVTACNSLREANFREMQEAGLRARDESSKGTRVVSVIAVAAIVLGLAVSVWLARSIVRPVQSLMEAVEAIRRNDFERRVSLVTQDELGQLAIAFNGMAEELAEYRRSSLGEVLAAKSTLEATINAFPDAILLFAHDGSVTALNPPAKDLLRAKGAAGATRLNELPLNREHRSAVEAALAGKAIPSQSPSFEHTLEAELNGDSRRFLITAVPILNGSEDRHGAVAILDDVTEFARLDELRSELIGIASHELRSPLTTLRMNLLMLQERPRNDDRCEQLLASAVLGCEELGQTIEQLLDVTRIESGQLRLNLAPVDLNAVLDNTQRSLQTRFDDAAVRIVHQNDVPSAVILGDSARLRSVFSNVLANALKYSPSDGTVTVGISTSQVPGSAEPFQLRIIVRDEGPGVPPDFRERVFEKFFRVEHQVGRRDNDVRGSGIGLYLCREIVKAHGGTITCSACNVGTGTCITITIPICNSKIETGWLTAPQVVRSDASK